MVESNQYIGKWSPISYYTAINRFVRLAAKKSGKNVKNREKNWQFYGVDESKIQSTVLEIKFIKGKNFNKN